MFKFASDDTPMSLVISEQTSLFDHLFGPNVSVRSTSGLLFSSCQQLQLARGSCHRVRRALARWRAEQCSHNRRRKRPGAPLRSLAGGGTHPRQPQRSHRANQSLALRLLVLVSALYPRPRRPALILSASAGFPARLTSGARGIAVQTTWRWSASGWWTPSLGANRARGQVREVTVGERTREPRRAVYWRAHLSRLALCASARSPPPTSRASAPPHPSIGAELLAH